MNEPKPIDEKRTKEFQSRGFEYLFSNFYELGKWIDEICRYGGLRDFVMIQHFNRDDKRISLNLYTEDYVYNISAREFDDNGGYLGCIASTRKPRAGEDWTRGSDLPDGKYSEKTWNEIVKRVGALY